MMRLNLQYRIDLLVRLGQYILSNEETWQETKEKASYENSWFIPEFIDHATNTIAITFLQKNILENWVSRYDFDSTREPQTIGITMAGNIPLAGFHDWLSVFISGHNSLIKTSSKDKSLLKHITEKIAEWDKNTIHSFQFSEMLKGCDAYIATGSNNSSRYFEYYFGKYPHIIRRNRTSAAILAGSETKEEFEGLADDINLYFGMGCRNVTKIFVPTGYDFIPVLEALKKYSWLMDHQKYRNNYDYNLAILLLNKVVYMSSGTLLLVESSSLFSPISQLNYYFYDDKNELENRLKSEPDLQCLVGKGHIPFGQAQSPSISDYSDGVDTLAFLAGLAESHKNQ